MSTVNEMSTREQAATAQRQLDERSPLPWLLAILVALACIWFLPYLLEHIKYRMTRGEMHALDEALDTPDIEKLGKIYAKVARRLNPSVVHIDTERRLRRRNDEYAALYGTRGQVAEGQASGVIVDSQGYIVTNNHVVEGATKITVNLSGGSSWDAKVIGTDPKNDLAVLKINAPDLIPAEWGDSSKLDVGEMVWAMGNPFGFDNTLTSGIVSAKDRHYLNRNQVYQDYLQTDAAVNPGNSGGPLVNVKGQIVGINTAIIGPTFQGISFAIPSNNAKEIYEQLKDQKKVSTGFLGVGLMPVPEDFARKQQLRDTKGALVTEVRDNTPAAAANLQQYDIIRKWDGREIEEPGMLTYMVSRAPIGKPVEIEIVRDKKVIKTQIVVAERPTNLPEQ